MLSENNPSSVANQRVHKNTPFDSNEYNTSPDVATHDLTRVFGQKVAVDHLNLTVRRGEFFGFLGPNGAEKSTSIKMMVGLLRPTSGSVWVGGVGGWKEPLRARSLIGVFPQDLNICGRPTGRE